MGGNSRSGSSETILVQANEQEMGKYKFIREDEDVVDGFSTKNCREFQIPYCKFQWTR